MSFALTDNNKKALENYTELWDEIKDQIKLISGDKPIEYKKDFMKIDNDLPLSKISSIPLCVIIVTSVFQSSVIFFFIF